MNVERNFVSALVACCLFVLLDMDVENITPEFPVYM